MHGHDIVVIGASAGGVEAMARVARGLPTDLPAAIFVVLHTPPRGTTTLPAILTRVGALPATHPADGDAIEHGHMYVAPPDQHLLVKRGHIHLVRGPTENGVRPAADPLFRTAARTYGRRVVGVVLSGTLDDGTAGLLAVKMRGGVAVVQRPDDALFAGMPHSAIENVDVDYCLPASEIAPVLVRLAHEPVDEDGQPAVSEEMTREAESAEVDLAAIEGGERAGTPSAFTCPECGGTLWEPPEGELLRFRCRVGHAYSADSLLDEQTDTLDDGLWAAFRALEESAALSRRLMRRARACNHLLAARRFEERAVAAEQRARLIRQALLRGEIGPAPPLPVNQATP